MSFQNFQGDAVSQGVYIFDRSSVIHKIQIKEISFFVH